MAPNTRTARPVWLIPLIALLAGLLIGWWGIGWALWPVTYNNALPPDLRATERDDYLVMVAEAYATSGNIPQAQSRLSAWPREQLSGDLQRLQSRLVTEDARRAGQVQALAGAMGVVRAPTPTPVPTAGVTGGLSGTLRSVCTVGLYLLLLLGGIAGLAWLWSRWRAKSQAAGGPAIGGSLGATLGRALGGRAATDRSAGDIARAEKSQWPGRVTSGGQQPLPPLWDSGAGDLTVAADEPGDAAEPEYPSYEAASAPRAAERPTPPAPVRPTRAVPAGAASTAVGRLSEYHAVYRMGEPDYDEGFDITDSGGAFLGQCGLGLTDPVGRNRDQAAALQVWLWDASDPDTRVKVLMSEGAYRDVALRDQLMADHEAVAVRPGSEFELETHQLLLRGTVEGLEYAEQEPAYGIFAELAVRIQVSRKG